MDAKVRSNLTKALRDLEAERMNLDRQITAVRAVLGTTDSLKVKRAAQAGVTRRRGMSAKARKLISTRMKAVWAKRRAEKKAAAAAKVESKRG
jgi:hypothetical protein